MLGSQYGLLVAIPLVLGSLLWSSPPPVDAHSNGHPPRIITPPKDQNVISGQTAIFICMAIGSPRPQIEWRKNNKRLTTQRYSVFEIPNGSVLRIEPVKSNRDNATYECLAENGVSEPVRATATLQVYSEEDVPYGFPSISMHPTMQGVEKGRDALMTCKVSGDPEPNVIWIKDMMPIDLTKSHYSLYQGASLKINDAQEEDQGPYECIAENKVGTAYSEQATLYVKTRIVPPFFSIPPESRREVMPGSDLNLTCVAVGSPMPYVSWRKGNIELNKENIPIGKNVLTLTDIQESENYTCVASSKHGTIETRTEVVVQSLPRPPNRIKATDVTPSSLKLAWMYENAPAAAENVIYFIVQYRPKGATNFEEKSSITTTYYLFESLLPYTDYEFRVLAANTIGRGEPSESFFITTGDLNASSGVSGGKKASSHPRNVLVRPLSTTVVVVQWEQPEEPNGQVIGYKVYYTKDATRPITEWDVQSVDSTELTTISDLATNVLYTLRVQAVTTRGMGSFSPPVQVRTQQGVPSQPQNLITTHVTATTVRLVWDKPDNTGEAIIGYDIGWNDTFTNEEFKRSIPEVETYTVGELYPDTLYYIWVTAKSRRGHGAATPAIPVKTAPFKPKAPPRLLHAYVNNTRDIVVEWAPPPFRLTGGQITHYRVQLFEIFYAMEGRESKGPITAQHYNEAKKIRMHNETMVEALSQALPYRLVFHQLPPWTQFRVVLVAINAQGIGPETEPIVLETDEDVPGEPRDVKVVVLNSTSIGLKWQAPEVKGQPADGSQSASLDASQQQMEVSSLIRGYAIYLQESNAHGEPVGEPIKLDVPDGLSEEFNVTGLQPDTDYAVAVAAVTRKGDGTRSVPVNVKTLGGVPDRPALYIQLPKNETDTSFLFQWTPPEKTSGQLLEYRLRYARVGGGAEPLGSVGVKDEILMPATETEKVFDNLEPGSRFEFRLAARNAQGWGKEAIANVDTPDGVPSGPPRNLTHRLQSPTTVEVNWEPPEASQINGKLTSYGVQFHKLTDESATPDEHNTTLQRMVFSLLDDNAEYSFRVRAYTSLGPGPWTESVVIITPGDAPPAPTDVQAMATSETSVEVWWDEVPFFNDILGYTILYTQMAVEDLNHWFRRETALTWSVELTGLEPKTLYAIRVAAHTNQSLGRLSELITVRTDPTDVPMALISSEVTTHSITLNWKPPKKLEPMNYRLTFGAHKEFYDSQGVLQRLVVPTKTHDLPSGSTSYKIQNLMPFTTYQVNVTAIASSQQYRPPAKLIVTTAMAAPKPMVKPDSIESKNKQLITVILPQASEEYGLISHYYLVVVPEEFVKEKEPDTYTIEELSSTPLDQVGPYITAKWMRRSIPNTFSLGDGQKYNGFVNRKLSKEVKYRIFVRAVVDTPQKSLFTSSPFSDILSLDANSMNFRADEPLTAGKSPGGSLDPVAPSASIPRNVPVVRVGDKSGAILILSIVLAILVVVLAIGFYIVKHRRHLIKYSSSLPMGVLNSGGGLAGGMGGDTSMKLLMNPMDGLLTPGLGPRNGGDHSLMGTLIAQQQQHQLANNGTLPGMPSDPVELRRLNYQTAAMRDHPPIPITELANHIELLKELDNQKFSQEYESIDPGQQFTWENSNLAVNKAKNRYANVIAYDHSRVVLSPLPGVLGSDYINANYCDGYRKPNAYIATQGPLPETFGDFWRMVWEQASASIVMMTKLEERTRVKCDQYWPSKGAETYGDIEVALVNYEELATYCIRTFTLKRYYDGGASGSGNYESTREVRQYQFTAWPDHGVPRHPTPFLMFLRRVRLMNPPEAGPLVIHCSAGVGRTGCYIVIDSMLERIKYEDTVDIYGHVTCLRAQRNYTVQTEDQYIFIYDAVLEAVIAGNTEVAAQQLYTHVQRLMPIVPGENCTGMELEFKKISIMRCTALGTGPGAGGGCEENKFVSANLPCNKHKNRLMNILPYESTRVYLQPLRNVEGSDYINANFIDGYRHRNAYIATQGPLMETADDFWRMVWEHNANIIVSLTQCHEMGREKCYQYWPADRSQRYSCFIVDPITEYNIPQYILREFKITDARDNQTRMIRQFHYVDWPEQGVPKMGESFIEFITQVHKTKEQFGHEGPIVVHCSAGVGRTGVFIALSIILERLQNENVIDLFQTVRTLRTQRPGMVQTEDQYQFCYRAVLEYISNSLDMAG